MAYRFRLIFQLQFLPFEPNTVDIFIRMRHNHTFSCSEDLWCHSISDANEIIQDNHYCFFFFFILHGHFILKQTRTNIETGNVAPETGCKSLHTQNHKNSNQIQFVVMRHSCNVISILGQIENVFLYSVADTKSFSRFAHRKYCRCGKFSERVQH